ncbi:hypothetical protein ACO0LM_23260 [Undibacterium sp. Di26W]|uniref:hypothetical protein n=1 Tax=Undibacterium sp. Di26W TaxID=3413035 RepID=UPI003BF12FDC
MPDAHTSLTLQMLEWIQQQPRSYSEVLDAWHSTCPRLCIWEDACADGLISCDGGTAGLVTVSAKGTDMLAGTIKVPVSFPAMKQIDEGMKN